jgi:hypothetical protein
MSSRHAAFITLLEPIAELFIEKLKSTGYRVVDLTNTNRSLEMRMASRLNVFLFLFLAFCLSGCYSKPVRHLASDIALLQVDKSTREDVVIFLGDPDEQQVLGEGVEKWLYKEKNVSLLQKTPLLGSKLGSPEFNQVVVTLRDGVVISCDYSYANEGDMGWAKDFSWQKKKK